MFILEHKIVDKRRHRAAEMKKEAFTTQKKMISCDLCELRLNL